MRKGPSKRVDIEIAQLERQKKRLELDVQHKTTEMQTFQPDPDKPEQLQYVYRIGKTIRDLNSKIEDLKMRIGRLRSGG